MKIIKFYLQTAKMVLSSELVYRVDFFIRMITLFFFEFMGPLVTYVIYQNSKGIPGWSIYEIMLLQSIFMIISSIERMFFQRADWSLSHEVKSGSFDRLLLYPIDTFSLISAKNFLPDQIFTVVFGVILFSFSFINLKLNVSFLTILYFFLLIILALILMYALAMLRFSIIIRVVVISRIGEFFRTLKNFAQYPVDIYGKALSSFFRYILPLAVLTNYPTSLLLNRSLENLPLIIIIVLLFFILTRIFWNKTLKNYASAGG